MVDRQLGDRKHEIAVDAAESVAFEDHPPPGPDFATIRHDSSYTGTASLDPLLPRASVLDILPP
jgi:hypothetical protein